MRKIITVILIILLNTTTIVLYVCKTGAEQKLTVQQILSKIEETEKKVKSISFNFIQQVKLKFSEEEYKIEGKTFLKLPDKLRLEYTNPEQQVILLEGDKIIIFMPKYNQVTITKLSSFTNETVFTESILKFVGSVKQLTKKYTLSLLEQNDIYSVLVMIPKDQPDMRIKLWILQKTWFFDKIQIASDSFDATFEVLNLKLNPQLDEKIFKLELPDDVQQFELPDMIQ